MTNRNFILNDNLSFLTSRVWQNDVIFLELPKYRIFNSGWLKPLAILMAHGCTDACTYRKAFFISFGLKIGGNPRAWHGVTSNWSNRKFLWSWRKVDKMSQTLIWVIDVKHKCNGKYKDYVYGRCWYMSTWKNKEQYLISKDKAEKWYDVSRIDTMTSSLHDIDIWPDTRPLPWSFNINWEKAASLRLVKNETDLNHWRTAHTFWPRPLHKTKGLTFDFQGQCLKLIWVISLGLIDINHAASLSIWPLPRNGSSLLLFS